MTTTFSFPFYAMGTDCVVHLGGDDRSTIERVALLAIQEVRRIENRYSRYQSESDLSAINQVAAIGGSIEVDEETAGLLDYALAAYRKSDGLFDITSGPLREIWDFRSQQVPDQSQIDDVLARIGWEKLNWVWPRLSFTTPRMELDFGGIGKEYAADQVAEICFGEGIQIGVIDLGGDIRILGPHSDHESWRIGIRHPRQSKESIRSVNLNSGAVATSGNYERFMEVHGRRYSHVLNPRTGWPAQGIASVTVATDKCLVAGTLSTIAMLKEGEAVEWLESLGVDFCCIDGNGHVTGTLGRTMSRAG